MRTLKHTKWLRQRMMECKRCEAHGDAFFFKGYFVVSCFNLPYFYFLLHTCSVWLECARKNCNEVSIKTSLRWFFFLRVLFCSMSIIRKLLKSPTHLTVQSVCIPFSYGHGFCLWLTSLQMQMLRYHWGRVKNVQKKRAHVMTADHCSASHSNCCEPQWPLRSTESVFFYH